MDVLFVQMNLNSYEQFKQEVLLDCMVLRADLSILIFYEYVKEYLIQKTAMIKQFYYNHLCQLALNTDYLLLALDDSKQTEYQTAIVSEKCPAIASFQNEYSDYDREQIKQEITLMLNNMENLLMEFSKLTGQYKADTNLCLDLLDAGEYDVLRAGVLEIEDLPLILPFPAEYQGNNTEYNFYWNNEDGSRIYPKVKESFFKMPDGCVVKFYNLSREDLLNYRDDLTSLGVEYLNFKEDEVNCEIYYEFAGSIFVLSWQDGIAQMSMLKNPVCFAPPWYAEMLFNEANNEQSF